MIAGIGVDVIDNRRILAVWQRFGARFEARLLTPQERTFPITFKMLAKRWAMKEAVAKALGTGIGRDLSFQQVEIRHDARGAPGIFLHGFEGVKVHISVTDEGDRVVAFAVAETQDVRILGC